MARPKTGTKYTLVWVTQEVGSPMLAPHFHHFDSLDSARVGIGAILDEAGGSYIDGSMHLLIAPVEPVTFKRETVTTLQIGEPRKRARKPRLVTPRKPEAKAVTAADGAK